MTAAVLPLLLSCTTAQIPDVPWEASLGTQGAVVFSTLSSNMANRTYAQFLADWDDLANAQGPLMCTRTSFFAQLKSLQESLCDQTGNCTNMTAMQSKQFLQFMSNLSQAQSIQAKQIKEIKK